MPVLRQSFVQNDDNHRDNSPEQVEYHVPPSIIPDEIVCYRGRQEIALAEHPWAIYVKISLADEFNYLIYRTEP